MFHKLRKVILLFFIILIAWFFRFNNINWDNGYHLHPDERFLTMVSTAMKLPVTINEYFNQKISLLNPGNIGYKFFVYGNFPLVINKYLAVLFKMDDYNQLTILGRQLSAFFDLLIVILVFKTTKLLVNLGHFERSEKSSDRRSRNASLDFSVSRRNVGILRNDNIALWSAFIYSVSVLPIQLSHFFTVDSFLNFFMFGSFYFILRYYVGVSHALPVGRKVTSLRYIFLSAVFFGLALACKVTALFILPLNLFFILLAYFKTPSKIGKYLLLVFIYFGIVYFALRLFDPYFFQNPSLFNPQISQDFISSLKSLQTLLVKDMMHNWYPPQVQWLNKNTVMHSLVNNIVFGFGIIPTTFLIIGIFNLIFFIFNQSRFNRVQIFKHIELLVILFWVIGFFVYQSIQVSPALRYFIIIYPFMAIFAGISINFILKKIKICNLPPLANLAFGGSFVILLLIWPLMFSSIYFYKHTRVEASEWIYKNLPTNRIILGESWDDSLPLSVVNNYGKQFTIEQLPVFDPDTPAKWEKMNEMLTKADFYVLSSNRGWGSITTVPEKYPLMSKFYNNLLSDKNSKYKKIKEFKPFYYRFFELPNNLVDEIFTVYDHPIILIYKNISKHK